MQIELRVDINSHACEARKGGGDKVLSTFLTQAQTPGSSGNALFTLLGAAVAALAATAGLFIKSFLDSRAESRKHVRDLELKELEHRNAVEKVKLELEEKRVDQRVADSRQFLAEFLACAMSIYGAIRKARAVRRTEGDEEAYLRSLKAVDATEGQVALERLRLSHRSGRLIDCAEQLWRHLRDADFPAGRDVSGAAWIAWKNEFWSLKNGLVRSFESLRGPDSSVESAE